MQREIITIPRSLMRVMNSSWDIDWRSQSLGETNAGTSKVVFNAFPRWVGSANLYLKREAILAWRAFKLSAQGQTNVYRLPLIDPIGFDYMSAAAGAGVAPTGIPFSTGETFSTGMGFEYVATCTAAQAATAGATQIRINTAPSGIVPKVGQIMGHDDWPFAVVSVTLVSTGIYDLGIQMPLRSAVPSGAVIRHEGIGLFEITEDGAGDLTYEFKHESRPVFRFREVLTR